MQRNLQNIFTDNKSISKKSAKTSKTLLSKKNQEAQLHSAFQPYYFKQNPLVEQMQERASRKKKEKTPMKNQQDHLNRAQNILNGLFQRHQETKQKIENLKIQAQRKTEEQCTFKPGKPKRQKYVIKGDMIRRNQVWLQQKKKKQVELKESLLMEDLNRCTFSPRLVSKQQSQIYLRNREHSAHFRQKSPLSISRRQNKKEMSTTEFQTQKKKIYTRLYTINV